MYTTVRSLSDVLASHSGKFHPVVDFAPARERLIRLQFSSDALFEGQDLADHETLGIYVKEQLKKAKAKYAIGGYDEVRVLYKKSELFSPPAILKDGKELPQEARNVHLGMDIWGDEGTKVYAPLGGMIHSFAFNDHPGDYGAAIVLLHQLDGHPFYTLYGHLSVKDITGLKEGSYISRGQRFAHFGDEKENGHWPPHLHFQIIKDMRMYKGDYPGVCKLTERMQYLENCPDPDLMLNMMQYVR